MTEEIERIRCLAQQHGDDIAFVVNHSGGKDSTRMLGLVRQLFPNSPTYAVMADRGFEHKSTIAAADWARLRCRSRP